MCHLTTNPPTNALYEIRVFDGKTVRCYGKKERADRRSTMRLEVKLPGPPPLGQSTTVLARHWRNPLRNENMPSASQNLIVRSLSTTLSDMHLADVRCQK